MNQKKPTTPRLPATLPEADWLPADLLAEVGEFNQAVERLAAEAAGEGEAASRALALAAAPSATFDALDEARHGLEKARIGRLLEARRLHARRDGLAGRYLPAAQEVMNAAEVKLGEHEEYLRARATKAGFGTSIALIIENDSEARELRKAKERARAQVGRIGMMPTGDDEAVAEIEKALADWLGVTAPGPKPVDLDTLGQAGHGTSEPETATLAGEPLDFGDFGQGPQGDAAVRESLRRKNGAAVLSDLQGQADAAIMTGAPGTLASGTGFVP